MPETAENVATDFKIEREAQDRMALASQQKAVAAQKSGFFDAELTPVSIAQKKGEPIVVASDSAAAKHGLTPRARILGMATAGVAPRIMGFGPAPATRKVLELTGIAL